MHMLIMNIIFLFSRPHIPPSQPSTSSEWESQGEKFAFSLDILCESCTYYILYVEHKWENSLVEEIRKCELQQRTFCEEPYFGDTSVKPHWNSARNNYFQIFVLHSLCLGLSYLFLLPSFLCLNTRMSYVLFLLMSRFRTRENCWGVRT